MATAAAITSGVIGIGTSIFGAVEKGKAKKDLKKLRANQKPASNPYANLRISTVGANLQSQQNLRALATNTAALNNSGSRGAAFIPQVSRQSSLNDRQIAANLDRQQTQVDQQFAAGEVQRLNVEENRFNQQASGLANRYAQGQSMFLQGFNALGNAGVSALSPGGAFAKSNSFRPMTQPVNPVSSQGITQFNVQPLITSNQL